MKRLKKKAEAQTAPSELLTEPKAEGKTINYNFNYTFTLYGISYTYITVHCKLTSIFARDSKIMQRGEEQKMLFRPNAACDGLMRVRANKYYPCEIVTYVYGDIFESFKSQKLSKFYAD